MKHEPMPDLSAHGEHEVRRAQATSGLRDQEHGRPDGGRLAHLCEPPDDGNHLRFFAVDNQPVKLWWPGDPVPAEWFEAARNPNWTARAHNDPFESTIEEHKLHPLYGFPLIPPERHRCTMAMSLALGFPAKLSKLADALEFVHRKDKGGGERLMHQMSKPRRPRKGEDPDGVYWHEEEDKKQRLGAYNPGVEAEREASGSVSRNY